MVGKPELRSIDVACMTAFPPIMDLIPHRAPMVFLDEVLEWEGERIACSATVRAENPFVRRRRLRTVVTLEHMAQCVAAFAGLRARERGEKVRVGLLVAVREMEMSRDFVSVGSSLVIEAKRVWGDIELGNFNCLVRECGEVVARASLSVVIEGARGGH